MSSIQTYNTQNLICKILNKNIGYNININKSILIEIFTDENGNFSFPGVPQRNDWLLTATEGIITGDEEICVPQPAPGPSCPDPPQRRAFAFVVPDKSEYKLVLKYPKLIILPL